MASVLRQKPVTHFLRSTSGCRFNIHLFIHFISHSIHVLITIPPRIHHKTRSNNSLSHKIQHSLVSQEKQTRYLDKSQNQRAKNSIKSNPLSYIKEYFSFAPSFSFTQLASPLRQGTQFNFFAVPGTVTVPPLLF